MLRIVLLGSFILRDLRLFHIIKQLKKLLTNNYFYLPDRLSLWSSIWRLESSLELSVILELF